MNNYWTSRVAVSTALLIFWHIRTRCQRSARTEPACHAVCRQRHAAPPCTCISSSRVRQLYSQLEPQRFSQQAGLPSIGRGRTNVSLASSRMWWLCAKQRYPFPAGRLRAAAVSQPSCVPAARQVVMGWVNREAGGLGWPGGVDGPTDRPTG